MQYINTETLEYPVYEGDIRIEFPDIGEKFVCPAKYAVLEPAVAFDAIPYGMKVVADTPIFENNVWRARLKFAPKSDAELHQDFMDADTEDNRKIRNAEIAVDVRLKNPDAPDYEEWVKFGQALQAFKHAWPRPTSWPTPPVVKRYDSNGNLLTVDKPGKAPNVVI